MPNMTGRTGHWTMEMNGGSSAPYLACTPCVPLFVHCLIGVETEGLLDYQRRAGIISIVPSDTKLLLTKNYSEIIIFEKLRISYVIPWKSPSFPEILKVRTPSKITKNNSQGIIFVIILCQRVQWNLRPVTFGVGHIRCRQKLTLYGLLLPS